MKGLTQCERLLAVLSDRRPHTHRELYRLGMIVHSRVADLRKRGYVIACWRATDNGETVSVYQLVSGSKRDGLPGGASRSESDSALPEEEKARITHAGPGKGLSGSVAGGRKPRVSTGSSSGSAQLSLLEAAA